MNRKEYKTLIEGHVVRGGIVGEKGFLFANDKLVRVNLKTGETEKEYALNFFPNYAYQPIKIDRIMKDKIEFGYPDHDVLRKYELSTVTGKINEIVP